MPRHLPHTLPFNSRDLLEPSSTILLTHDDYIVPLLVLCLYMLLYACTCCCQGFPALTHPWCSATTSTAATVGMLFCGMVTVWWMCALMPRLLLWAKGGWNLTTRPLQIQHAGQLELLTVVTT